jgi:hypothetical protein
VNKRLWHLFSWNLNLSLHYNLGLSHVTLPHVLLCFPTLKLSSLHLIIFSHPNLTHMKSNSGNFLCHDWTLCLLHIYRLNFHLKNNFLPSNFENILLSNNFLKVPHCKFLFFWKIKMTFASYRPWTLNLDCTTFPFF